MHGVKMLNQSMLNKVYLMIDEANYYQFTLIQRHVKDVESAWEKGDKHG